MKIQFLGEGMKIQYNEQEIIIEDGKTAKDLAEKMNLNQPDQSLVAVINGKISDLSSPLNEGDQVLIIGFDDPRGKEVFWHTSAHVLAQAVLRLWPNAKPTIGPAIENGFYYDFANLEITESDFLRIEEEIKNIISENHKPIRLVFKNKQEALSAFSKNNYKIELIQGFPEEPISSYQQGEFHDLCRGPHLPALGKIKAFKILKTSGAYWRGDSKKEMLTRIYGISFPDRKSLKDYLNMLEEAKKRDHKIVGPKLDLFSFKEEAPGMPFIHPRGMIIWNQLLSFLRNTLKKGNYQEIKTPMMMTQSLWEKSGHWEHYRENMYTSEIEKGLFAIKPMNCPGCMLYFDATVHSYRELPLRIAEIGHVHRHEPSGALNGLFRVRSFHQDDAHLFMEPSQIRSEILEVLHLADYIYMTFGLSYRLELSTRPEKSIGSDEDWENATNGLKGALDDWGHSYRINEGDGAFYGPKIDIHIKDALGRHWQCGTIQLDLSLPEKFSLKYVSMDGSYKRPVMIHRALFGSIERFMGILVEHFSGKFPFWLSPYPITIIPVADRHLEYAQKVADVIQNSNLICDIDNTKESVSKKIRNAQLKQSNYMLTIGDKELENQTVSLRTRDNIVHGEITVENFLSKTLKEKNKKLLMSLFSTTTES